MKFKQYWKEIVLVMVLYFVLSYAIDFLGDFLLGKPTQENIFSPIATLIGMLALIIPLIAALPAGYLIKKKGNSLKEAMLYPAIALVIAGLLMLVISITMFSIASEEQSLKEFNEVKELGLGLFEDMSLQEFKAFTISMMWLGSIFIVIFNFALGAVGGWIGSIFAKGK